MGWTAYIRKGKVFVPTSALTTDGLLINVEPIEMADVADRNAVARCVHAVIARGIRTVPAPDPREFSVSPMFALAGVASWSAFYKGAKQLGFMSGANGYEVFHLKKSEVAAYYVVDESTRLKLPPELTPLEVADFIANSTQAFAKL